MPTVTLLLNRPDWPGGMKPTTITYNGNAQVVGRKKRVKTRRTFMFEMEPAEKEERLAELRAHCQ